MGYIDEKTGEIVEWNNGYNHVKGDKDLEENSGELVTIPDMSFTVQEILEKYTRGVEIVKPFEGTYDEGDFDDINPFENPELDLTDIDALTAKYNEMIKKTAEEKAAQSAAKGAEGSGTGGNTNPT